MPFLEPHPSVVCATLDDGGVLLHLDTKYYYSLNETGMALWALLESGAADPSAALTARYPNGGDAPTSIPAFLSELEHERLVQPADAPPAGPGEALLQPPTVWVAPRLVRHDVPLNQILSNPFDPSVPLAE